MSTAVRNKPRYKTMAGTGAFTKPVHYRHPLPEAAPSPHAVCCDNIVTRAAVKPGECCIHDESSVNYPTG